MKIGYARVSSQDQNLNLQLDALKEAGCERTFTDKVSGAKAERPGLVELLAHLRNGDVVVIWKLDRLGRSLKHLVELVADFNEKGVGLVSLNDPVDTTTGQDRRQGLSEEAQHKAMIAETLYKEGRLTVQEICERLGIARAPLYSYLRSRGWRKEG